MDFNLPRIDPEAQGIPSKVITDFIASVDKNIHSLHSFMLLSHGNVVAEGWWHPWRPEAPHMLFSLTKSFTSSAVGLAQAEGLLKLDDPVISFFEEDAPKRISENLAAMKIQHLLSMSTGHELDTTELVIHSRNPAKAFLVLPVEKAPGTHFVYNSGASFMLSTIVQKLTGKTLVDYLTPRLFEPLGIKGATWETHPNGVNFGGWGLNITTEAIARFGQLYLQKGEWCGKRILPEAWVEAATRKQVSNGNNPESDWTQGYGYHFWRCRHNIYRGDGAFSQFCIIMPDQEAVLAITAGASDMQPILNIVWDKLLPALGKEPLPTNKSATRELVQTIKYLRLTPPTGSSTSPMAERYTGKTYAFERNYETLRSIQFDFLRDECVMTYYLLGGGKRRGKHSLTIGYGKWKEGVAYFGAATPQPVTASGVWTTENTFTMTICQYETPFVVTIPCRFEGDKLFYDFKANVSFGQQEFPQLVGMVK